MDKYCDTYIIGTIRSSLNNIHSMKEGIKMLGLIAIIVFVIGYFIFSCKNSAENSHSKQNARNGGQNYYLDWEGKQRRIDNDHQVLQHVHLHSYRSSITVSQIQVQQKLLLQRISMMYQTQLLQHQLVSQIHVLQVMT